MRKKSRCRARNTVTEYTRVLKNIPGLPQFRYTLGRKDWCRGRASGQGRLTGWVSINGYVKRSRNLGGEIIFSFILFPSSVLSFSIFIIPHSTQRDPPVTFSDLKFNKIVVSKSICDGHSITVTLCSLLN